MTWAEVMADEMAAVDIAEAFFEACRERDEALAELEKLKAECRR